MLDAIDREIRPHGCSHNVNVMLTMTYDAHDRLTDLRWQLDRAILNAAVRS